MDDDFDTVKALAIIFDFIRKSNKNKTGGKNTYKFFQEIDEIFGILNLTKEKTPQQIKELVEQREEVRKNKDFKKSDELRAKIKSLGYWVEDTAQGPKIKKI